ncbi:hypothetical protein LB526_01985 [Mesorhizobium sp. CA6]|uniref:hypothetical protein n=1 Tax=Mesorhizobium sp. CA6 TaxID=588500 RepID=UPI001CC9168C|nr:hypothetical protein [Mesorhizobium sp. CA6]MBZ9765530.1 hypothetical protein [Mesorhizobium sp. CA6]
MFSDTLPAQWDLLKGVDMADTKGPENLGTTIGLVKDVFSIIGVIAAGIWAFFVFDKTQAPQFARQLNVSSSIGFFKPVNDPGTCGTTIDVTVTNDRNATVEIKALSLKLWHFDYPKNDGYFDFEEIKKMPPTWELPRDAGSPLTGHYYPKSSYHYQFEFFGKPKGHYVYYLAEIATNPPEVGKETFSSYHTTNGCFGT